MKILKAVFVTPWLLMLAACGGVTPDEERLPQTGVDAYGAYTVVAERIMDVSMSGRELFTESSNISTKAPANRTVQLRQYGSDRYGTALVIRSQNNSVTWRGALTLDVCLKRGVCQERSLNTQARLFRWKTWAGNTGALQVLAGRKEFICAVAEGRFEASSVAQTTSGQEVIDGRLQACYWP